MHATNAQFSIPEIASIKWNTLGRLVTIFHENEDRKLWLMDPNLYFIMNCFKTGCKETRQQYKILIIPLDSKYYDRYLDVSGNIRSIEKIYISAQSITYIEFQTLQIVQIVSPPPPTKNTCESCNKVTLLVFGLCQAIYQKSNIKYECFHCPFQIFHVFFM